ncbi:unnamed protein product [marine sediment metagenome]|uniref:Uncharacterized protein n=1 Tax=marine sediment metagenome TaxID=412755 RepID=X1CTV2_9ZZZZ
MKFTDKKTALRSHQEFKWDVIAKLPQKDFEIDIDIKKWVRDLRR